MAELYGTTAVAEALDLTPQWVRMLQRKGELKPAGRVRGTRQLLYDRCEVERLKRQRMLMELAGE